MAAQVNSPEKDDRDANAISLLSTAAQMYAGMKNKKPEVDQKKPVQQKSLMPADGGKNASNYA